jgi:transposase-like protein
MHRVAGEAGHSGARSLSKTLLMEFHHRLIAFIPLAASHLAIHNIAKKWTMPIHNWKPALNCFAIEFAGRFPQ